MRNLLKTVTLILLAAPLLGAEIRQITPPAGQSQVVLQAPSARGTWKIAADDSLAEVQPQLLSDCTLAILQAAPGRYLVRWRAGPLKPWQAATIDLGGSPKPPDPPKPEPQPLPVPTTTAIVVLIEETAEPHDDVDIAAIRLSGVSGEIAKVCKSAGISWRCIDKDVKGPDGKPPPKLAPFLAAAKDKSLPWIVGAESADDSGASAITFSQRCPADVAGVLALLKGGAK